MAVVLDRTSIMPIDTLLTLSASPPISFFTGVDSLRYPSQYQRRSATNPINRGYYDVSCYGAGTLTQIAKPRNLTVNGFSIPSSNMVKEKQPLRSCLRVKMEHGASTESLSQDQMPLRSNHSDLEDQMDNLKLSDEVRSVCSSNSRDGKRVVFADSKGLPLETIKVLDSSDVSLLNESLMKQITQDAKPEPDHPYTYTVDFEQPASSYLQFRERIEYECVSLENVMIKDNIKIIGTVKVKNIAFEKSVTVRVTFDKWRTHQDVAATFVPQTNVTASRYDTFAFEFDIPPNQGGKEFEFCVNFLAPGVDGNFWDSNHGKNYRIVSQERRRLTQQQKLVSYQSLSGHLNWGEFSYWKSATDDTPYW